MRIMKNRWRSCVWLCPSLCFHSEESQAGWAPRWGPALPEIDVRSRGRDLAVQTQNCVCDKKFVSAGFQSNALSLSFCPTQRSLTLMWHSKYKMWRAQPLLSGATCPAGSKTSCCESFIRALLSLDLLFHSFLCCVLLSAFPQVV